MTDPTPRTTAAPPSTGLLELVDGARTSLLRASRAGDVPERHVHAQLAALRAAAALVAARRPDAGPVDASSRHGAGSPTLWELLPDLAPELAEWAGFFAHSSTRRWAVDGAGDPAALVSAREADDLLRQAETFVGLVHDLLGLPRPADGPARLTPVRAGTVAGHG